MSVLANPNTLLQTLRPLCRESERTARGEASHGSIRCEDESHLTLPSK